MARSRRRARPQDGGLSHLTDVQLLIERDRSREVLEHLVRHPGTSPSVGRLFTRADQEIEQITGELVRRVVARGSWSSSPLPHSLSG
jgi:hypothetical protein